MKNIEDLNIEIRELSRAISAVGFYSPQAGPLIRQRAELAKERDAAIRQRNADNVVAGWGVIPVFRFKG